MPAGRSKRSGGPPPDAATQGLCYIECALRVGQDGAWGPSGMPSHYDRSTTMSAWVYRLGIGVGLWSALWLVGCTRDRVEGLDLTIDLDPVDVAVMASERVEAARSDSPAEDPQPPITYIVQAGDNLATIASAHYVSLDTLRRLNPQLQSDQLVPGDELLIPVVEPPPESARVREETDSGTFFYVVQAGDTVSGLAAEFGITVEEIKATNPSIVLDRIAVGQRLAIPEAAQRPPEEEEPDDPNALYHLVQAGENLSSIAALYGVDSLEIARLNRLVSPDRLGIGQRLLLPANATLLELPTEEAADKVGLVHTVVAGETLSSIALRYEVRLSTLVAANNLLNADQLAVGQAIYVPGVAPRLAEGLRIHTVRAGETLLSIAELYQVPFAVLEAVNNLADSDNLAEGQELIVPEVP